MNAAVKRVWLRWNRRAAEREWPSTNSVTIAAGGKCPGCGYYNSPDISVRGADDEIAFCVQCRTSWRVECP